MPSWGLPTRMHTCLRASRPGCTTLSQLPTDDASDQRNLIGNGRTNETGKGCSRALEDNQAYRLMDFSRSATYIILELARSPAIRDVICFLVLLGSTGHSYLSQYRLARPMTLGLMSVQTSQQLTWANFERLYSQSASPQGRHNPHRYAGLSHPRVRPSNDNGLHLGQIRDPTRGL